MPRNSMGKVQKVELAKQYADLFKGDVRGKWKSGGARVCAAVMRPS
jgi:hypothetical protein